MNHKEKVKKARKMFTIPLVRTSRGVVRLKEVGLFNNKAWEKHSEAQQRKVQKNEEAAKARAAKRKELKVMNLK